LLRIAHAACVREYGRAIGLDVLIEPQAGQCLRQDGSERRLAHHKRLAAQVLTV
jgi:hypothetical protein